MALDAVLLAELEPAEVGQRGDVPRVVEGSRGGVGEEEGEEGGGDEDEDGCHILRIRVQFLQVTILTISHHISQSLLKHWSPVVNALTSLNQIQ